MEVSSGSESYNLQALASKPNKRQKAAIFKLDQLVISHLTDYFSVWQLKTKLEANKTLGEISNASMIGDPAECSMDYSVFRRNLAQYERAFSNPQLQAKNSLTNKHLNI